MMDKRETVEIFKQRLTELIDRTRLSRAQFAAKAGLDRSTLSQLLAEDAVRLPRADTIARIAARHKVSAPVLNHSLVLTHHMRISWLPLDFKFASESVRFLCDVRLQTIHASEKGACLGTHLQRKWRAGPTR